MKRFLTVIRRIALAGVVSLILLCIAGTTIIDLFNKHSIAAIFFLVSPLAYLIFVLVSVAYVRKYGQFAETHREHSPVHTVFRCIGSDIASPFKCIGGFFGALFNKNAIGRGVLILRFIGMVVIIFACLVGMGSVM